MRIVRLVVGVVLVLVALSGCGIPQDPDATLDRALQRGDLRVGVVASPPLAVVDGSSVTGPEADLIAGFAESRGLRVRWLPGGQEELVKDLEHGNVDVLIGGFTKKTPWEKYAGVTRAYAEDEDAYGETVERVVAVPLGENALVAALERYFDDRVAR